MKNADHAWSHMLDMHLHVLPHAYALSAKQKQLYRHHEQAYWRVLGEAVKRVIQGAWARWVAPSRCDRSGLCRRLQARQRLGF